jgi:hypothetical protein
MGLVAFAAVHVAALVAAPLDCPLGADGAAVGDAHAVRTSANVASELKVSRLVFIEISLKVYERDFTSEYAK